jgi:hypothetical protein
MNMHSHQSACMSGQLFRALGKPFRLPLLCSRENFEDVFGSHPSVIAIKIGILAAGHLCREVGAAALTKAFDDGLRSGHLSFCSAPTQSVSIREENGTSDWVCTATGAQLCTRAT